MTPQVIDRWTTQHGSWDVNVHNPFGIDQAHRDRYFAGRDIPGAGADHHIIVKVPSAGLLVVAVTDDGQNTQRAIASTDLWVNFPMSKEAGYSTARHEKGTWQVWIGGQMVADGIGLPDREHVSTFLVIADVDVAPPAPEPARDVIELYVNGVVKWHN